MGEVSFVPSLLASSFFVFLIWKYLGKPRESPALRSVAILVLGDVGRSPRMMYHAESFAKLQFETYLVGYEGARPSHNILTRCRSLNACACRLQARPLAPFCPPRSFPLSLRTSGCTSQPPIFNPCSFQNLTPDLCDPVCPTLAHAPSSGIYTRPGSSPEFFMRFIGTELKYVLEERIPQASRLSRLCTS